MNGRPSSILFGVEELDSSTVGVVEAVAPAVIDVALLQEAPHGTALSEGAFHRFPRLNSYLVLPSERGSILAMVIWIGIDNDAGRHAAEHDRIGLPIARRRLKALPLGVLRRTSSLLQGSRPALQLDRGVLVFPTVGDPVRLPTQAEAAAAIPAAPEDSLAIAIGRAPLAGDLAVRVDPNRLFGRHLAVLGNTGSGKSCTVAQLLRRSAEAAGAGVSAFRAIVFDLNGEYRDAFNDLGDGIRIRRLEVVPTGNAERLRVPAWVWNYAEWLSLADASAKSQAPQLRRALHLLRTSDLSGVPRGVVGLIAGHRVLRMYEAGAIDIKAHKDCLGVLDNARTACLALLAESSSAAITALGDALERVLASRRGGKGYLWDMNPLMMNAAECTALNPLFLDAIEAVGVPAFLSEGFTIDSPVPFDDRTLLDLLPLLAADSGPEVVGWVAPLVERLRISFADERLRAICGWQSGETFDAWLKLYLSDATASQITILDLSLVPSNVLHLVAAILARVLLEALERHRRLDAAELVPVVLVVEEAHTLLRRRVAVTDDGQVVSMSRLCREAFERIAREGRKFGLSLVISSQRPGELSETVLSQCNTFLVHRIVNDHDQRLVERLVPDSVSALVRELPALPSQMALLLGWASDVPTMVRIDDLDRRYRPRSADPDFGATWRGERHGTANWSAVVDDWVNRPGETSLVPGAAPAESAAGASDD